MRKLFFALLFFVPQLALAVGGTTGFVTLTQVKIGTNGNAQFSAASFTNPDACANNTYVYLTSDKDNFSEIVAGALSALANSLQVQFYVYDCATVWGTEAPDVTDIYIKP